MGRPGISVIKGESVLGTPVTKDGVSLLIVSVKSTYTLSTTKFLSLKDAETAGATEALDISNANLLWEHIKDFYAFPENEGVELNVMLIDEATTFTNLFTPANANYVALEAKLTTLLGEVKQIGVALNPSFTETNVNGISAELITAIPLAQTFCNVQANKFRPVVIVCEGRKFTGTVANATDLSAKASGNVGVMIDRDDIRSAALVTAGIALAANYAQIGLLLGKIASVHVGRNVGRIKSKKLPNVTKRETSGGVLFTADSDLNGLYAKGYIFFDQYVGKDGCFFVDDKTAEASTSDYNSISRLRTWNKAVRIMYTTYIENLKDDLDYDVTTGRLSPVVIKGFENDLETAILADMRSSLPGREKEIAGVNVTIDPLQDVLTANTIEALLEIYPLAQAKTIIGTVKFAKP